MNPNYTLKQVVLFVEGLDPTTAKDNSETKALNKLISEGNSTVILDTSSISAKFPLISFLGFGKTFKDGFESDIKVRKGELRWFKAQKVGKGGDEDDEIIEVKYVPNPKKITEIANVNFLVCTSSEKMAQFCETSEINYYFEEDLEKLGNIIQDSSSHKNLDALILHLSGLEVNKVQPTVEEWLEKLVTISPFIKVIYSHFATQWKQQQILDKNIVLIKDEKAKPILSNLIPNQTWQFNRGELVNKKDTPYQFMLLINFRNEYNRADEIQTFEEYKDLNTLSKFGGNVVEISGILREILFENAKLPKFGA